MCVWRLRLTRHSLKIGCLTRVNAEDAATLITASSPLASHLHRARTHWILRSHHHIPFRSSCCGPSPSLVPFCGRRVNRPYLYLSIIDGMEATTDAQYVTDNNHRLSSCPESAENRKPIINEFSRNANSVCGKSVKPVATMYRSLSSEYAFVGTDYIYEYLQSYAISS